MDWNSQSIHTQKVQILTLKGKWLPSTIYSPQTTHDPNAMDINAVILSKLIPAEQARCIREELRFWYRKKGHGANWCNSPRST